MDLFAANCTPQHLRFNYRVSENDRSLFTDIPSGENRRIGDNTYSPHQIAGIIESNKLYGMYDVTEMERVPDGAMISILFSRDKPVRAELIRDAMARNRKDLTAVGATRRKDLAIAATHVLNQQDPTQADRSSVAFEEETPGTMSTEAGSKLGEGYAAPGSRVAKETRLSDKPNRGNRRR